MRERMRARLDRRLIQATYALVRNVRYSAGFFMKKHLVMGLMAFAFAGPAFAEDVAPAPVEAAAMTEASAPEATAPVVIERREMIVSASGARVGNVISLNADGSPRVIFEEKVVSIPLDTLSRVDGRLVTSLSFRDLRSL